MSPLEGSGLTLRGATLNTPTAGPSGRLTASDLREATLTGPALGQLHLEGCRLDHARISGGELGRLSDCSLRGAHLLDVTLRALERCDLEGATLERCDLRGATLRDCGLRGTMLRGCQLDDVDAQGTVLSDTLISPSAREQLLAGGGRSRGVGMGWIPERWAKSPGRWLALLLPLLLLLGLPLILLPARQAAPGPDPEDYTPPPDAEARTRDALAQLREGLEAAHQDLSRHPGRHWPTLDEVQANHYDIDGDGPGQDLKVLVPGGLPRNLLSAAEGSVLPYCNAVPDQATLTGVDTDWHYCPESGRVFASAALTEAATLEW